MKRQSYVLVTPAYNEEALIARTIECVIAQTQLPAHWAIVSDASTDRTDDIIASYALRYGFIEHCQILEPHKRKFSSRIRAINFGCSRLGHLAYEYIGTVDADVTLEDTYFASLVDRFAEDPGLGLAGGVVVESEGCDLRPLDGEYLRTVANAAQLLRRRCYDDIGGYPVLPYGGPDTYAEVAARMKGWRVRAFPELLIRHGRYTASAGGLLRGRVHQGMKDFSLGYDPVFEWFKCARRVTDKPVLAGSMLRLAGYYWARVKDRRPAVSAEFVQFLQEEQKERVRDLFQLSHTR